MFLTIVSAFAEFERARIRERIMQAKKDQRARGLHLGGPAPFGFRVEDGMLISVPEQQTAIEDMKRMRAERASLRQIAAAMAERGHKLSHVTVKQVLEGRR